MKPAVNTVTLRSSTPDHVVSILLENGITAVEWAGNEHVPPGDVVAAKAVRALCDEKGLFCASYASYYPCDEGVDGNGQFSWNRGPVATLDSAQALGVDAVRVWAGRQASASASPEYRNEVARCLSTFCEKASALGMTVHLEFHRNTIADTASSALKLIAEVGSSNLISYWQPRHGVDVAGNLEDIAALGERISNVHVFHWLLKEDGFSVDRRPLVEGKERWRAYFEKIERLPGERYAMLEFVRGGHLAQFSHDVSVLLSLVGACGK